MQRAPEISRRRPVSVQAPVQFPERRAEQGVRFQPFALRHREDRVQSRQRTGHMHHRPRIPRMNANDPV
jgi:hypothetical protein